MSSTVEDWLRSLGLIQYTQAFLDNGYDELDICKEIGEEDLDAIGVRNIKDRVDILSAVLRLKQSGTAVYFVLEEDTQPTAPTQTREKILPLKLKMFIRDTLKDDSIDLTEPPYTQPNGACGNLDHLVTLYADKFYTYEADVLEALESIRARQVGDLKSQHNDIPEEDDDEAYDQVQSSPSKKNKHKRSNTTPLNTVTKETSQWHVTSNSLNNKGNPADYLDVDSSSSPHKKVKRRRPVERNSKLSRSLDSLKELHVNTAELKTKDKDQQTSKPKQSSSIFGLFRSSKRKSPGHEDKSPDTKSLNDVHISKPVAGGDLPASNITMGEEDRVTLMLMVKRGELTVEEAVQQLESYEKEHKKIQASKKDLRRSGSCSEEESASAKSHKLKRNIFGRSTKKKSSSRPGSEIAACDMTMSEEDRINLMKGVRDHEITVEEAVQRLLSYEEESPGHKGKFNKHKFSPKSLHSFSRLSIKRVSGTFGSAAKGGNAKDEKTSIFYTPREGAANTSSEGCSEDDVQWRSDSSPDPSPAGHRKVMHNVLRRPKQIHSTSSLHSSSSSSDAVDRLGTIEDLENQESPTKIGANQSPEKRIVDEMKNVLSKREETGKRKDHLPTTGSTPIHVSTLPRNGKPSQTSLSRKSSLPITPSVNPALPIHVVRKPPPPPPPRPLPRQATAPLIEAHGSSPDSSVRSEPDKTVKPKPPRRRSFGDHSKNLEKDVDSKTADVQRSLSPPFPPAPRPRSKEADSSHTAVTSGKSEESLPSPPSEIETKTDNQMSFEDDVFPPPPPEHMLKSLKPASCEGDEIKKVIPKPPRPSLLKHTEGDASCSSDEKIDEVKQNSQTQKMAASVAVKTGELGQKGEASAGQAGSPGHTPSASAGSPGKEGPPGPPILKPKPAIKRKPPPPPKPPKSMLDSSSKSTPEEQEEKSQSNEQQAALNVVQVPRKRPSHSLSDLIERRLRIEQIDLTELPYSSTDGKWDVPINLIDRYTEEMRRSQKEVVEIMDKIRCSKLREKHRIAIPCDTSLYPQEPDNLGKLGSLEEWLISLGLPMYLDNLREVEYDDMTNMPYLKQKHFEYAGVVDLRHMRRLLASVERMPK